MKRILRLISLAVLLPLASHAATLTPCVFAKYAGAVMPLPSETYMHFQILTSGTTVVTTQTVPVVPGHIVWALQTGTANWQQCWSSPNSNPCTTNAPSTSVPSTNWEPNPIARTLDYISGTTTNDLPNLTTVQSNTSNSTIGGSYCYQ